LQAKHSKQKPASNANDEGCQYDANRSENQYDPRFIQQGLKIDVQSTGEQGKLGMPCINA